MVLLVMAPTDILKSVFVYDIRCVLMRQIIRLKDRDYLCRLLIRFDRVNVRNSDVLLHSVFFCYPNYTRKVRIDQYQVEPFSSFNRTNNA